VLTEIRVVGDAGQATSPPAGEVDRPAAVVRQRGLGDLEILDDRGPTEGAGAPHGDDGDRPLGVLPSLDRLEHDVLLGEVREQQRVAGVRARKAEP
jgi:hypothetical protein